MYLKGKSRQGRVPPNPQILLKNFPAESETPITVHSPVLKVSLAARQPFIFFPPSLSAARDD